MPIIVKVYYHRRSLRGAGVKYSAVRRIQFVCVGYFAVFSITSKYEGAKFSDTVETSPVFTVSISISVLPVGCDTDIDDTVSTLCDLLFTTQEDRFLQLQNVGHIIHKHVVYLFLQSDKKDIFEQYATLLQGMGHS